MSAVYMYAGSHLLLELLVPEVIQDSLTDHIGTILARRMPDSVMPENNLQRHDMRMT